MAQSDRFALRSTRYSGEVQLFVSDADAAGGDYSLQHFLPAGFGRCLILEAYIHVSSIATMVADPHNLGAWMEVIADGNNRTLDPVGVGTWRKLSATSMGCHIYPDQPVLWEADPQGVRFFFPELDTNAAPTGDVEVYVRVKRLDQQAGPV